MNAPRMAALTPHRALQLSIAAAVITIAMKAGAWWVTGAVGFLSDALESVVNLAGAAFALAMVAYARQPPDTGHPFGHGKAEYFSAAFEGGMILLAALAIIAAATERLITPQPLAALGLGTALSVAASAINLAVARVLFRSGRAYRSIALEADGRHLMSDVWTTAGVIVGVGLAGITGHVWLDPLVAIAVALNLLREGARIVRRSTDGLMDRALDDDDLAHIAESFAGFAHEGCTFANLRTRAAGALRFAQVDMRVPPHWTVKRAHELADAVEAALAAQGITLVTHIEPLDR